MKQFDYVITDKEGIHARPAGELVKTAMRFQSKITLKKGEKSGDAKRIFAVMGLGAKQGEMLSVTVEGEDEEQAAAALEEFFSKNM